MASASPRTSCIVVEVVGREAVGAGLLRRGKDEATSASRPSVLSGREVIAMSGMANRLA